MYRAWCSAVALVAVASATSAAVAADAPTAPPRTLEFRFTPTARAQLALWIETADGTFASTLRLTQAVAVRGIGNRPGASQMNSGFRWPYGRRLDVLPIWANRRAAAPGAQRFKQVVFQHRPSEGCASNAGCGGDDSSIDSYFCLSFLQKTTQQAALDAVSCASLFRSDKGRYLTETDAALPYTEPVQVGGVGMMRPLELTSLYPPRRDAAGCGVGPGCIDHPDAATYVDHARAVMPELDTVTMATAPADVEQSVLFTVPDDWPDGNYVAWLEINVEGDHNDTFSADAYPTPQKPAGAWDTWASSQGYGYPYRGQPSIVYQVPFVLGVDTTADEKTIVAAGYSDPDAFGEAGAVLHPMDPTITDDSTHPGSGVDRLRLIVPRDYRFKVAHRTTALCEGSPPPEAPASVAVMPVDNQKFSHQWGTLRFVVPSSVQPVDHYEVRFSAQPIVEGDEASFMRALPAMAAKIDSESLIVPAGAGAGSAIEVRFGGMYPETEYWVAIRAVDVCNRSGPFAVSTLRTTKINFTKLSGCFIATAAYGSALEPSVAVLRRARDALRPRSVVGATAVDLYYRSGPAAAALISRSEAARAVVRSVLGPVVGLASAAGL